jgi:hypothetical protein
MLPRNGYREAHGKRAAGWPTKVPRKPAHESGRAAVIQCAGLILLLWLNSTISSASFRSALARLSGSRLSSSTVARLAALRTSNSSLTRSSGGRSPRKASSPSMSLPDAVVYGSRTGRGPLLEFGDPSVLQIATVYAGEIAPALHIVLEPKKLLIFEKRQHLLVDHLQSSPKDRSRPPVHGYSCCAVPAKPLGSPPVSPARRAA